MEQFIRHSTYIEIADTCFEGDDGSYRHIERARSR